MNKLDVFMKELEIAQADVSAFQERITEINALKRQAAQKVITIEEEFMIAMETEGGSLESSAYTATLKERRPSVSLKKDVNPESLPESFRRIKYTANLVAVRSHYFKTGESISKFFDVTELPPTLSIKPKRG